MPVVKWRAWFCAALLVSLLVLNPVGVRAEDFVLTADAEGLVVEAVRPGSEARSSQAGPMSPGDSKTVELWINNTRNEPFTLTVEAGELSAQGGLSLLDGLWVEVSEGGAALSAFPARGGSYTFADPFLPGSERLVMLTVFLPGEAGNEYQNLQVHLQWLLTARSAPSPPPGAGGSGGANAGNWIAMVEEGVAALFELDGQPIPLGNLPQLPKTGAPMLWPVLAAGAFALGAGFCLTMKRPARKTTANGRGDKPTAASDKIGE